MNKIHYDESYWKCKDALNIWFVQLLIYPHVNLHIYLLEDVCLVLV